MAAGAVAVGEATLGKAALSQAACSVPEVPASWGSLHDAAADRPAQPASLLLHRHTHAATDMSQHELRTLRLAADSMCQARQLHCGRSAQGRKGGVTGQAVLIWAV